MSKRIDKPKRYRAVRNDATVGGVEKSLSKKLNLPKEAVKFVWPSGRDIRSDCLIETVRKMCK